MFEQLFVYGTLGPGRPNEHVLGAIGGTWEPAAVTGTLRQEGWGAAMGYPGIDLDEQSNEVEGFLFSSENLSCHWAALDKFEGEAKIAKVDINRCSACGTCTEVCAYKAVEIILVDERLGTKAAFVNPALCKGCGTCCAICR